MFVQLSNLDFRILNKRSTTQDFNGPYKNTAQLSRIKFRTYICVAMASAQLQQNLFVTCPNYAKKVTEKEK